MLISQFQIELAAAREQSQVPAAVASQQTTPADAELQRLKEELKKAQWSYEALEERSSEEEQRLMVSGTRVVKKGVVTIDNKVSLKAGVR